MHIVKGKTDGQQGDPLEMLIFNLTVHHIWGRVLAKFQGTRAVTYDGALSLCESFVSGGVFTLFHCSSLDAPKETKVSHKES